jgi:phospholipid/cholesterol/gamma-HCH transport system substrate-binding protein
MSGISCSRARLVSGWIIAGLVVSISATSCGAARGSDASAHFCAIMSDSIGLYAGNPVTQMGYKIGTIDNIIPRDTSVEVRFTLNGDRPIPNDIKAVTRSTSILADRSLELAGTYSGGPRLLAGHCIPRSRTFTPLSISQVVGSATNFVNGISPDGSTNLEDALRGFDAALRGNGPALNRLLTTSSSLLDSPDQAIADMSAIVRNVVKLTVMLKESRTPIKQIVQDMPETTPYLVKGLWGIDNLTNAVGELILTASEVSDKLGDQIQVALDTVADALRHLSPHYKGLANMLNPVPRFINTLSYYANRHDFDLIAWSPPLFRIRTPDGLALCGAMNASMPGSCADVNGQPHAVDVALLQYVLTEAARR